MKNNDIFKRLGSILNPLDLNLEQAFVCPDYALETLINGNISECISYLRRLIGTGSIHAMNEAHEQLVKIKDACPDRYEYIKTKTFSL